MSVHCVYVVHMILRVNGDYFPKRNEMTQLCNKDRIFIEIWTPISKYYLDELQI
jgi:hypothetical protein